MFGGRTWKAPSVALQNLSHAGPVYKTMISLLFQSLQVNILTNDVPLRAWCHFRFLFSSFPLSLCKLPIGYSFKFVRLTKECVLKFIFQVNELVKKKNSLVAKFKYMKMYNSFYANLKRVFFLSRRNLRQRIRSERSCYRNVNSRHYRKDCTLFT